MSSGSFQVQDDEAQKQMLDKLYRETFTSTCLMVNFITLDNIIRFETG